MSQTGINPYLQFNGTAAQALALYQRALDAIVVQRTTFAEAPGMNPPADRQDWIMHAELRVGGQALMLSDTMPGQAATAGTGVHICLHFDDVTDMKARFAALSAGGTVTTPVQDTFWGATFGTLTDAVGIHWMFNCPKQS